MSPVTLRYGNLMAPRLGGAAGLEPGRLRGELSTRFSDALRVLEARRDAGELGFLALPEDREMLAGVREVADSFGQWFETLVVIGIGGSSLGARTVVDALLDPYWNEHDDEARDHFPRLYFLENPDPGSMEALLGRLDPRRTLFNVVSKSGGTAETLAQYLVVEDRLRSVLDEDAVRGHLLFTTDPASGPLRSMAEARGIPTLAVPENVGGRFSVLSPVGLLPAAATGVDVEALLAGAGAMASRCLNPDLERNPAGMLALLLHAADTELGHPVHVFMPYGDALRTLGQWFQQLWAESLGKVPARGGEGVGPTPLAAVGAVDQHSVLQLLMEGPRDKVVVFVRVREHGHRVAIPEPVFPDPALDYLGGHTLAGLLDAELQATREALRRAGRPSITLELDRVDARSLGEAFMLLQVATVLAGALYDVDPLDQPGVELGKRLTSGLLGRDGYEPPDLESEEDRWTI
jgi:glucose-6-phosphate isomerase